MIKKYFEEIKKSSIIKRNLNNYEQICQKIKKYILIFKIIAVAIVTICVTIYFGNSFGYMPLLHLATNSIDNHTKYDFLDVLEIYPVLSANSYIAEDIQNSNEEQSLSETEDENIPNNDENSDKNNKHGDVLPFDITVVDAFNNNLNNEINFQVYDTASYQKTKLYGITIANYATRRDIDYEKYLKTNLNLSRKSSSIFLYCTHTSESYINSENYQFEYSGNMRVRDAKYNMLKVTSVFSDSLRLKGFDVQFDTTPHDYTSYENSYKNSRETLRRAVNEHGNYTLTIDMHRDAYGDLYSSPTVSINGKDVAQLMLVVGIGTTGYENPYWETNLSIALQIMKRGEEMYPGLFRAMCIRDSKYNQDMNEGAILVESGATGNTHEQVFYAVRCLANILEQLIN